MFYSLVAIGCAALLTPTWGFMSARVFSSGRAAPLMVATEQSSIVAVDAPDFYWQFRLDRLVSKKGADLAYSAKNYEDCVGSKALYDAYYLDLTLQGKMENFDWAAEKEISDSEWLTIYRYICNWSSETSKKASISADSLPANDFDLLKAFYPSVDMRALDTPFAVDEVGANFPYKNMKELLGAASAGTLKVPGFDKVDSLDSSEARAALAKLKDSAMSKVDAVYEKAMSQAKNPLPDAEAVSHYKELRSKLATFPQSAAEWKTFRANFEKEVDEMARLAGKNEDEHHHGADHVSPAKEFEMKYGRNLDEMQERFNKYKADPEGFLEASIIEKFGPQGLSVWKKSQEFSAKMSTMSEDDKASTEKAFADFLKSA
mmetsp:Transcript_35523/g.36192  ORF Transcript_35523/g.36192 Transcript_35523/m.36192 type:complete len:374 (-) Transcript_35523:160-1281(-)|eukprot:CAMPEP_0182428932 /NCGR_PEP_ID=MMETSP1167-20130531/24703_1 /TAXON_ID=2988 /ORGANISM="Mallomonas Sp, Strain CCMP3275" /LENGTH=373 /DNA_ID=CAMNT_0024612163 /DNA_START=58 /DNA_END=1179 /DNA_ORIENTATION=+